MLYEGLTGRPPFAGERIALLFQQVHTPAPPLTAELAPGVPEGVIALVLSRRRRCGVRGMETPPAPCGSCPGGARHPACGHGPHAQ